MDRADIEALFLELGHHRADLGLGEHEVTHDGHAAAVLDEGGVRPKGEARLQRDAVQTDLQV